VSCVPVLIELHCTGRGTRTQVIDGTDGLSCEWVALPIDGAGGLSRYTDTHCNNNSTNDNNDNYAHSIPTGNMVAFVYVWW